LLIILGLTTIQQRRKHGDLTESYKLLTGKEEIDWRGFSSRQQLHIVLEGTPSTVWSCLSRLVQKPSEKFLQLSGSQGMEPSSTRSHQLRNSGDT